MVEQKVSTSKPQKSACDKQVSNGEVATNKREIQDSPTNRKKNTMQTSNEDVMKMESDTMSTTKKNELDIENTGPTHLVRDDLNQMSIRSMMPVYLDYESEKGIDEAFLEDASKVFIDMEKFIDLDSSVSAVTKLDYVRYTKLLRSEGKSSGQVMRMYCIFLDFFDWAEEHGAGSAKANYPKTPTDTVEDYEAMVEQIDALYEKNWTELWNSVVPKELR